MAYRLRPLGLRAHAVVRLVVLACALLLGAAVGQPAGAATAAADRANPRSFTCSGNAGDVYTAYTVAGQITALGVLTQIKVTDFSGAVVSQRYRGVKLGASPWHAGFTEWNITGPNPDGYVYHLSIPPAPPGGGGFMDADLFIDLAGAGNVQLPMFDCSVTGGGAYLSTPPARPFSCEGAVDVLTHYTITGTITNLNAPKAVRVTNVYSGLASYRSWKGALVGPSWLHAGYTDWNVTGPGMGGDIYHLNIPPVLPPVGGYFDADLDIELAVGGGVQVPIFDCHVG